MIRAEFDMHRNADDLYKIKYFLSDGRSQLKLFQEMMSMK